MGEVMEFPNTLTEFLEQYGFYDELEVYTNGSLLIPAFRAEQAYNHYCAQRLEDLRRDCAQLEQLCRDMYESLDNYSANVEAFIDQPVKRMSKECAEVTHSDVLDYYRRMDALGLLEGGEK